MDHSDGDNCRHDFISITAAIIISMAHHGHYHCYYGCLLNLVILNDTGTWAVLAKCKGDT